MLRTLAQRAVTGVDASPNEIRPPRPPMGKACLREP